jgi:hypothetical protein
MPHYYFSIENGERIRDPLGEDLPDDAAALSVAQHVARDLARAKLNPAGMRVVVRTDDDSMIGTAWVKDWRVERHDA